MDLSFEKPMLLKGDCLEVMKTLPDKSVDLFICDLPYGETNCSWDSKIDLVEFWKEFKRLRKSKKTACIHFCSTKFGYTLIKSWEKGFKMDMVWKKRNKSGGLQSRYRPMRNHEMVYFFYEQAPKYNRDKYHKRIKKIETFGGTNDFGFDTNGIDIPVGQKFFDPPNPASVLEEKDEFGWDKSVVKEQGTNYSGANFEPPNPVSIVEEAGKYGGKNHTLGNAHGGKGFGGAAYVKQQREEGIENHYTPLLPTSVFNSEKVFIGKRNHQTEKPQDILEFFLKYWTDEGDVILDPTMGSGSTGVACKKLKRNFVGIELTDKYYEVAKKRIT